MYCYKEEWQEILQRERLMQKKEISDVRLPVKKRKK